MFPARAEPELDLTYKARGGVPRAGGDEPMHAKRGASSVPRAGGDEPMRNDKVPSPLSVPRAGGDEGTRSGVFPARAGMKYV